MFFERFGFGKKVNKESQKVEKLSLTKKEMEENERVAMTNGLSQKANFGGDEMINESVVAKRERSTNDLDELEYENVDYRVEEETMSAAEFDKAFSKASTPPEEVVSVEDDQDNRMAA